MKRNKLIEEEKNMILLHLNDRPRSKAAQLCGVSESTFYSYVKLYGGEIAEYLNKKNPLYEEIVRANYPTMSASEIADKFPISKGRVIAVAKRLGLQHTPETEKRLYEKVRGKSLGARTTESFQQQVETWKKTRKMEHLRFLSGLPQQTKFHFASMPEKTTKAIWHLTTKYNYFRDEKIGGLYTLFYDEQTHRTPMEHLYTKRYGLKFKEA